ncbi:hypothetical protein AB0M20_00385 [Actinoplanes sp. NPDC051633]|uniref:hypothetical protein n=1 Tax=Actinoplanes sp. NPDC051633 TaxID=3155670 RepID=UPI003430403C
MVEDDHHAGSILCISAGWQPDDHPNPRSDPRKDPFRMTIGGASAHRQYGKDDAGHVGTTNGAILLMGTDKEQPQSRKQRELRSSARPGQSEPSSASGNTSARLGLIGVIAAALIAMLGGIIVAVINDDDDPKPPAKATPTSSASASASASASVSITFTKPTGTQVKPGTDVPFEGTVRGLASGQVVWLLSRTPSSKSLYYIVGTEPIVKRDGGFDATAFNLGDETDLGSYRTFFAVLADAACSEVISAGIDEKPRAVANLVDSCKIVDPTIKVFFTP